MTSVAPAADWQQAYDTWCVAAEAQWRPCPRCRQRRVRHGWRARYGVVPAAGRPVTIRLRVQRVRCRPCHTVETLYPPWLWPYLLWPVPMWVRVCEARWVTGAAWPVVAAQAGVDVSTVRRRLRGWAAQLVAWRQHVAQQATTWGVALIAAWLGETANPPAVGGEWLALVALWSQVAVALGWPGTPPLVAWLTGAPLGVPAPLVAPHTHWGRRLRAAGCPP